MLNNLGFPRPCWSREKNIGTRSNSIQNLSLLAIQLPEITIPPFFITSLRKIDPYPPWRN